MSNYYRTLLAVQNSIPLSVSLNLYYKFNNNLVPTVSVDTARYTWSTVGSGYITGIVDNCRYYGSDGYGNYIYLLKQTPRPEFSLFSGTTDLPFSISIWVNYQSLVGQTDSAILQNQNEYALRYSTTSGRFEFRKYSLNNASNYQEIRSSTGRLTINNWVHVAVTDDGTGTLSGMRMYINGVEDTAIRQTIGTYVRMSTAGGTISVSGASLGNKIRGATDELAIWKGRTLTDSEVLALYTAQSAGQSVI